MTRRKLFRKREFAAHWFETGTPTFLVDTLFRTPGELAGAERHGEQRRAVVDLRRRRHADRGAAVPDRLPDHRAPGAAGRGDVLGYPNREVRQSLNRSLLSRMTGDASRPVAHSARLYDLLLVNDFTGLAALVESFFASIPYEWYTNNDIASYEGFYASVFYSYFAGLGLDVVVEDSSSHGRLDMAVRHQQPRGVRPDRRDQHAGEGDSHVHPELKTDAQLRARVGVRVERESHS